MEPTNKQDSLSQNGSPEGDKGGVVLKQPQEEGLKRGSLAREIVLTIILAALIFAGVQVSFQSFRVEGISMEPNVHDGQYILVNKALYLFRSPHRGEVIVFELSSSTRSDYIKRIIALPGETVWAKEGKVYIQDAGGRVSTDEGSYTGGPTANFSPYTVPPDHYFVLGDNRDHSMDSRFWKGISKQDIIGKAWLFYWPPGKWGQVRSYSSIE